MLYFPQRNRKRFEQPPPKWPEFQKDDDLSFNNFTFLTDF